jgi:hypothetical protein
MAAAAIEPGDTLSVRPFLYSPSLDTSPVEIHMQGVLWLVPRNFLESASFSSNHSTNPARPLHLISLRIVTTLSTLKGAIPETLVCYKALRAAVCPDTIVMLTQWGEPSPKVRNAPAIAEAARDPRDDLFGLTKVNAKVGLGQEDVYVFYGGSAEKSTVIQCVPSVPSRQELLQDCTVRLEVIGVPMSYSFARSQLPNWRRIQGGVVPIIKSVATGDAK